VCEFRVSGHGIVQVIGCQQLFYVGVDGFLKLSMRGVPLKISEIRTLMHYFSFPTDAVTFGKLLTCPDVHNYVRKLIAASSDENVQRVLSQGGSVLLGEGRFADLRCGKHGLPAISPYQVGGLCVSKEYGRPDLFVRRIVKKVVPLVTSHDPYAPLLWVLYCCAPWLKAPRK
jgi:hypothetical protein